MAASSTSCCSSSFDKRASVNVVLSRKIRRTRFEVAVRSHTSGRASDDRPRRGRAARSAYRSAFFNAKDFGTSSPRTRDRKEIDPMTTASAASSAILSERPARRSISATIRARSCPPNAAAVAPTTVIPIWTVARNLSGCARISISARAERFPSSASSRTRVLRTESIAISAPANKPFPRMSITMRTSSVAKDIRRHRAARRRTIPGRPFGQLTAP